MQKRQIVAGLMGMNQDVINPQVNSKHAFEIRNFRINPTANSNSIELTSEKSTKQVTMLDTSRNSFSVNGSTHKVIGHCSINNSLVLFVAGVGANNDMILHFKYVMDPILDKEIFMQQQKGSFVGDLNFSTGKMVECIPFYENDDIVKIYWIDGRNNPRVINIENDYGYPVVGDGDPFGFYQTVINDSYNRIDVVKSHVGGMFYAGVVQYAFSFYNKNAQETPVIYTTPLNYVSHSDRGEEPGKQLGCAFELTVLVNVDDCNKFDFVRMFSIYRSSLDASPVVKVIKDIKCEEMDVIQYNGNQVRQAKFTDTNEHGYDFDAYKILVQNEHIVPNAIAYKDMKLFLGNYESDSNISSPFSGSGVTGVTWTYSQTKQIDMHDGQIQSVYMYSNQNNEQSDVIKTFKYGEYYKFALQFQDKYGEWSNPVFICTSKNTQHPVIDGNKANLPYAQSSFTIGDIYSAMTQDARNKYVKVRPLVSFPTVSERSVLCQGIVNPTVFNRGMRKNGTCTSQSSWFFRPFNGIHDDQPAKVGFVQHKHMMPLFGSDQCNGELQNMYFDSKNEASGTIEPNNTTYPDYEKFEDGWSDGGVNYPPFGDSNIIKLEESMMTGDGVYDVEYTYDGNPVGNVYSVTIMENGYDIGRKYTIEVIEYENGGDWDEPYPQCGSVVSRTRRVYYWLTQEYTPANEGIQCRAYKKYNNITDEDGTQYDNFYFVDQQIQTVNSPDIEFDTALQNVDLSQYKFRIVGAVDFLNVSAKYRCVAESQLFKNSKLVSGLSDRFIRSSNLATGFFDKTYSYWYGNAGNDKLYGRMLSTGSLWMDDLCCLFTDSYGVPQWNRNDEELYYFVYPWQRQHLNNWNGNNETTGDSTVTQTIETESSRIVRKVLANLRYCNTRFFDTEYDVDSTTIKLFNSNENQLLKLSDNEFYYGNVDQLVTETGKYSGIGYSGMNSNHQPIWTMMLKDGYPIVVDRRRYSKKETNWPRVTNKSDGIDAAYPYVLNSEDKFNGVWRDTLADSSTDPIMIRYKSSPHIVCKLDDNMEDIQKNQSLPDQENGYLYLCDIYKDMTGSPFVDNDSTFNLKDREWLPCGDSVLLGQSSTEVLKWMEGDTFFQRYDCLKTYPFSNDDYQSVIEISSFMVETHVNMDGRYDRNRGLEDNTFIGPKNFNLINPVYSQKNNFFNYSIIDEEDFFTRKFPTRFTWSLNKVNGQDVDEWTRTNASAFYDCDGDKGPISSIRRFNNQLYAFQDKGISRIKYNENVALSTQNGVPVELGNSATVNGVDYISEMVGSQNKWSCVGTPNGIFFVDNFTPGIYRLGGGQQALQNLTKNVMQRWFESKNNDGFISQAYFDGSVNEVLFQYTTGGTKKSLAYNCDFGVFSSFYDYKGFVGNIKNHAYDIVDGDVHFLREGNGHNTFYGTTMPYWIEFVANPNIDGYSPLNAMYDNVWYNADIMKLSSNAMNYNENIAAKSAGQQRGTFDSIEAGNEYQYGVFSGSTPSTQTKNFKFIEKFRTWRVPVPRNQRGYTGSLNVHRDRMRSQWLKIKLKNTNPGTDKMVVRNIYVDSFC